MTIFQKITILNILRFGVFLVTVPERITVLWNSLCSNVIEPQGGRISLFSDNGAGNSCNQSKHSHGHVTVLRFVLEQEVLLINNVCYRSEIIK